MRKLVPAEFDEQGKAIFGTDPRHSRHSEVMDSITDQARLAAFCNGSTVREEIEQLKALAERNYKANPDPDWPTEQEREESFVLDRLGWREHFNAPDFDNPFADETEKVTGRACQDNFKIRPESGGV